MNTDSLYVYFGSAFTGLVCIRFNYITGVVSSGNTWWFPVNYVDGEVLHVVRVSRLHMGAYLCVASNGVPPSISKRVELRVQCKFRCIYHQNNLKVLKGSGEIIQYHFKINLSLVPKAATAAHNRILNKTAVMTQRSDIMRNYPVDPDGGKCARLHKLCVKCKARIFRNSI